MRKSATQAHAEILALLRKVPCTVPLLVKLVGKPRRSVYRFIEELEHAGVVYCCGMQPTARKPAKLYAMAPIERPAFTIANVWVRKSD